MRQRLSPFLISAKITCQSSFDDFGKTSAGRFSSKNLASRVERSHGDVADRHPSEIYVSHVPHFDHTQFIKESVMTNLEVKCKSRAPFSPHLYLLERLGDDKH